MKLQKMFNFNIYTNKLIPLIEGFLMVLSKKQKAKGNVSD